MPGGNGMGPTGMGPMTGRAAGYCAGNPVPGYANPTVGRALGYGLGRGFGRGLGLGFRGGRGRGIHGGFPYAGAAYPQAPAPTPREEADRLKEQAAYFEDALANVKRRIDELESTSETST